MKYTIDRFEGDFAVLEDENRTMKDVPRASLPTEAKEGDVLIFADGKYSVDAEETARRKEDAHKRLDRLWKR